MRATKVPISNVDFSLACSGNTVPAAKRRKAGTAGELRTEAVAELARYEGEHGTFMLDMYFVCEVHNELLLSCHLVLEACQPLIHHAEETCQLRSTPLVIRRLHAPSYTTRQVRD